MPETTLYTGSSCYVGPAYYGPVGIWVSVARYLAFSRKAETLYFYMSSAIFKMLKASHKVSMGFSQPTGCQFATCASASMTGTILDQEDLRLDPQ